MTKHFAGRLVIAIVFFALIIVSLTTFGAPPSPVENISAGQPQNNNGAETPFSVEPPNKTDVTDAFFPVEPTAPETSSQMQEFAVEPEEQAAAEPDKEENTVEPDSPAGPMPPRYPPFIPYHIEETEPGKMIASTGIMADGQIVDTYEST